MEIAGPNGCGKTSLMRMICGLLLPEFGIVSWDNLPIDENRAQFQNDLVYLGHSDGIKGDLTVLENVCIAHALHGGGISPEQALLDLHLEELADLPGRFLSAGQRRRTALTRLLVNKATLWLLDEPFTALDKTVTQILIAMIETHAANGGIAVFSSHHAVGIAVSQHLELTNNNV